MALTAPPSPLPDREQTQTAFDTAMAAYMVWLPTNVSELTALQSGLSSIAAGTAFAIPYTFSTTTTDSDPGAGVLRLSSATQNAATVIRADLLGSNTSDYTAVLADFASSSSVVKGQIRLVKQSDSTKWLTYNITALASPSGYKNITVTPISGSSTSPLTNGDAILLLFTRSGDAGVTLPYLHVRDEKSTGTNGGGATATTFHTRTLNSTVTNTIPGASLASDTITLPAGTYQIHARAPASQVNGNRISLYNSSDSTYTVVGASVSNAPPGAGIGSGDASLRGSFTIASSKNFIIKHYVTSTYATYGLGQAASDGVNVEIYAEVEIWKTA